MRGPGMEWTSTVDTLAAQAAASPWGAVREALARIGEQEAGVRAWTHVAPLNAMREAGETPSQGLLQGVPFGVKDVIDVADMPTGCGSAAASQAPCTFDASCVSLLRRAGAVPVGKTVTAEYAFRAPGPTQNPRAPGHTPGGSSSGSAAAVAAGMVPFALGTQTGGSIIRPAAYCGVVGFKPSFGGVFRDGLTLTCESLDVIGWHARSVADAQTVARVLLPFAPTAAALPELPRRVAVVSSSPEQALDGDGAKALQDARHIFESHGVACVDVPFEAAAAIAQAHNTVMQFEFARSLEPVARRRGDRLSAALLETVRQGFEIPFETYLQARHQQAQWRAQWSDLFGEADLILTPSASGAAPRGMASTGASAFNRIWSLLGWPCLHLPTGHTAAGLPIGVQLVGRFEADHDLLRWGRSLHVRLLEAR
ncbi:amidase [Hydrogenophaga sp. BPS33]|uniref:amidase n=1 Tax=Hydrogenophaga sp. BPS33 TaxID=2651974 RepID=UPI00131FC13F|nr:amidase [Hydrogenophaga sp. BPS33]QHE84974.1 amidase [Hydrogenophaga sp. BPS33]